MLATVGEPIRSASGHDYIVEEFLGDGGEGETYRAVGAQNNEQSVVKLFRDHTSSVRRKRLEHLLALALHEKSQGLYFAPRELIEGQRLGHVGPLAPGQPVGDFLEVTEMSLIASLGLALSLVTPLVKLESEHIGHGDIHIGNVLADGPDEATEVIHTAWVDFDNFIAPQLPCQMIGPPFYAAPELVEEYQAHGTVHPTIESDRFSLGILLSDVIFRKHPKAGCNPSEDWVSVARSGVWPLDPARRTSSAADLVGVPVLAANDEVISAFRLAFSRNPAQRPSAARWYEILSRALHNGIYECPHCQPNNPVMVEPTRTVCPWPGCPRPRRRLGLKCASGKVIVIDRPRQILGRAELGGSDTVSRRQLILVRIGMETLCEAAGKNPTYLWDTGSWQRLTPGCPLSLEAGDRLRVADIELEVVEL